MLALAGLDVGTSFGGIGSSREMMIASLAEPAMLMVCLTLSLLAARRSSRRSPRSCRARRRPARVARARAGRAGDGRIAENARIPVDNPRRTSS
jgi:hypothetical protein